MFHGTFQVSSCLSHPMRPISTYWCRPDIGGAMVLGGNTTTVRDCSFFSNSVSSRGLAVAVVGSVDISGSTFDGNELYCASGLLYREDTKEVRGGATTRSTRMRNDVGSPGGSKLPIFAALLSRLPALCLPCGPRFRRISGLHSRRIRPHKKITIPGEGTGFREKIGEGRSIGFPDLA